MIWHQTQPSDGTTPTRRTLPHRRRLIPILCLLAVVGLWFLLHPRTSAEEELAAIDAAHVIPAGENAAEDLAALVLRSATPVPDPLLLPQDVRAATLAGPWRSVDLPEAARWIEDHRAVMDGLMAAACKPKCWFAVADTNRSVGRYSAMEYQGAMLLLRSANNDLGEGRAEAALGKLLALLRVTEHLHSQAHPAHHAMGWAVGEKTMEWFVSVIATRDIPEDWLPKLHAALPPVEDTWNDEFEQCDRITRLYVRRRRGVVLRLQYLLDCTVSPRRKAMEQDYRRYLSASRAGHIVLALRCHKNASGAWPIDLTAVEAGLRHDTFVDPVSRETFVYRPAGDSFVLYSVGPNALDEGGEAGDDRLFWPR